MFLHRSLWTFLSLNIGIRKKHEASGWTESLESSISVGILNESAEDRRLMKTALPEIVKKKNFFFDPLFFCRNISILLLRPRGVIRGWKDLAGFNFFALSRSPSFQR